MPHSNAIRPRLPAPQNHWLRNTACVLLCLLIAACGFRLKGVSPLPFTTLYTNITENSAFGAGMRRAILASSPGTRFVGEPEQAEARLIQLANSQGTRELSIDAHGQVEEYELSLSFVFQLTDSQGRVILAPTTLTAIREVPYDANVVQAKQSEISMVFNEMQQSMIDRVVRHLSAPDVVQAFRNADTLSFEQSDDLGTPAPEVLIPPGPNRTVGAPNIEPGHGF